MSDEQAMPAVAVAPEGDTIGLNHVGVALQDLPFPMTREALLARAGAWRMPITGAAFVPLSAWLEGTKKTTYANHRAVMRDIARAHPELRRSYP